MSAVLALWQWVLADDDARHVQHVRSTLWDLYPRAVLGVFAWAFFTMSQQVLGIIGQSTKRNESLPSCSRLVV
jgi:hypothetical protein